ncbi:PaaI family thioesterase [Streptomyces sp. NPDC087300]|uniref:PaaI family thioesterase n=1 Tax=Streptomyces sp. NPDC087300 TaxID=3365780 RepID=UPI00380F89FD
MTEFPPNEPQPVTPDEEVEPIDFEMARKVLDAQPFSRLVRARITRFGDGAATLEIDVREELQQQNGFLHGGVLAYAADNSITFAAGTTLGPAVLTSGFSIQYVRPATGAKLIARATVAHSGRRQAVVRCELLTVSGAASAERPEGVEVLCAIAQGTVLSTA